jgi:hypothetical protein
MSLKSVSIVLFLAVLSLASCKKEGPGGKAKIYGKVAHHGNAVPNSTVYIKYGASEFPGTDVSQYERSYQADVNGDYAIGSLVQGNYYLYSVGYEENSSGIVEQVTGGAGVTIEKKDSKQQDIAVTE